MSYQHESIFPPCAVGFGMHNVGGVLRGASKDVVQQVNAHYGLRCGHIPTSEQRGVVVPQKNEAVIQQMVYLSEKYLSPIAVVEPQEIPKGSLVVPYIRTTQIEEDMADKDVKLWGPPGALTHVFKNKAEFHLLVQRLGVDCVDLPYFRIAEIEKLGETIDFMVNRINQEYEYYGVSNFYPIGVVIRAGESDGNFGNVILKEEEKGIALIPDGDVKKKQHFATWAESEQAASEYLRNGMDDQIERRLVVTRWMDIEDSPGISLVIHKGEITSLGWNGQVRSEGSTACIGTRKYTPRTYDLQQYQNKYEAETGDALAKLIKRAADELNINLNEVSAMVNFDLMIPGKMEQGLNVLRTHGSGPGVITLAESNFRITNWSDACLAVGLMHGLSQTPIDIKNVAQGGYGEVVALDRFPQPIPSTVDIRSLRDSMDQLDRRLSTSGSRVLLRMPDKPTAGVIMTGNVELVQSQISQAILGLI